MNKSEGHAKTLCLHLRVLLRIIIVDFPKKPSHHEDKHPSSGFLFQREYLSHEYPNQIAPCWPDIPFGNLNSNRRRLGCTLPLIPTFLNIPKEGRVACNPWTAGPPRRTQRMKPNDQPQLATTNALHDPSCNKRGYESRKSIE